MLYDCSMSQTIRSQILAKMKDRLEAISEATGYNFTLAKVRRFAGNILNETQFPVVLIDEDEEAYDANELSTYRQFIKRRLNVKLTALIERVGDDGERAQKLLADLEKAITSDATFGGVALDVILRSNDIQVARERTDLLGIEIELIVFYRDQRTKDRATTFGFALDRRHVEPAFKIGAIEAEVERAPLVRSYAETFGGTSDNKIDIDVIMKMLQKIYGFVDDQGEPMNGGARNFMLMVPTNMWGAALVALSEKGVNTGSGVRDNPLVGNGGFNIEPICNPRLTWTTKLALFRTDGRAKPFILHE